MLNINLRILLKIIIFPMNNLKRIDLPEYCYCIRPINGPEKLKSSFEYFNKM